jgi:hypothetical protein
MRDLVAKAAFQKVEAAADAYYRQTGDMERVLVVMAAENNGSQTAWEHGYKGDPDRYPFYWQVCLGSLNSDVSDADRAWFWTQGVAI